MKTAIVAVAGTSSRFNENEKNEVLKGIYTVSDERKTLLYSILKKCRGMDKVVLVGGYRYEDLEQYVRRYREEFPFLIQVVYNPYFKEFGTGYTLKLGLEACLKEPDCGEIILIEGDLFFDEVSFQQVKASRHSAATYNAQPIDSRKAVIAYVNQENALKYIFSTNHGAVEIKEPFLKIYNSGQIWKFADTGRVKQLMQELPEEAWEGTNLRFIEAYFSEIKETEREMIALENWENCNTRLDYLKYMEQL